MSVSVGRKLASVPIAAALLLSSTVASAAAQPASVAPQAMSPWMSLSVLGTTSSATAATTTAAAQDDGAFHTPPILPLVVILATVGVIIWLAVSDDDSDIDLPPLSPG